VGRYVSEAWFGRQLARHPPAYRRVQAQPEPTGPAGMAPIITGTVLLLLAVSIPFPFPFLNVKLLGLIMIVAGLVKARALQRASSWVWRNRRVRNGPARPLAGPAPSLRHGQPEPVRQARPEPTGLFRTGRAHQSFVRAAAQPSGGRYWSHPAASPSARSSRISTGRLPSR
jgi:hypothetical protein